MIAQQLDTQRKHKNPHFFKAGKIKRPASHRQPVGKNLIFEKDRAFVFLFLLSFLFIFPIGGPPALHVL